MADNNSRNNPRRGRGWHGDSQGHAEAGRKGGQARGKRSKQSFSQDSTILDLES